MLLVNRKLLFDSIEREKAGIEYPCSDADRELLVEIFREIRNSLNISVHYLSEIDAFKIPGSGEIIAHYINRFSSESIKAVFIPQLVLDKIKDCDKILLQLYLNFKESGEYISIGGVPAPAHIYVRYDNAFRSLKPKRLKDDLIKLAYCPRDVVYLPLTMNMLASWKIQELNDVFLRYSSDANITHYDVAMNENDFFSPPFSYMKRELRLISILALKNYPSQRTKSIISEYLLDPDPDIRIIAAKTLKTLAKKQDTGRS